MSIVSTLYLATDSKYSTAPTIINKANLASVSWLIDWDNIFRGKTGLCRVSINLVSKKGSLPKTWNGSTGIMSATFASNYALNSNGFPLTQLNRNQYIEIDATGNTAYVYYYSANNTQNSVLPVINIPTGKETFTITMSDTTGALITSFPEYNVFLHFEWLNQK